MEGGYTFIRRYTLPVIRDDEGIVPYGFYRDPRMNGGGDPHPSRRSRATFTFVTGGNPRRGLRQCEH